jgi:hypothetical protein
MQDETLQNEPSSLKPNLENPNKEVKKEPSLVSLAPHKEREERFAVLDHRARSRAEQIEAIWKRRTGRSFTDPDWVMASNLVDQHGLHVVAQVLQNTLYVRPKSAKMLWTDFHVFADNWQLNQDAFRAWAAWNAHQKGGWATEFAAKFKPAGSVVELTEKPWQQFKTNCTEPETWIVPDGIKGRRALCEHLGVELSHFARVVAYCVDENRLVSFDQFKALLLEVAEIVPEEPEPDQAKAAAAGFTLEEAD